VGIRAWKQAEKKSGEALNGVTTAHKESTGDQEGVMERGAIRRPVPFRFVTPAEWAR
jgi:hypothetical protein